MITTANEITMQLPASSRFVATARVTTASIAAELDYPIDAIEDLRTGVNELAALVIEWCEDNGDATFDMKWTASDNDIQVHAVAPSSRGSVSEDVFDELTRRILAHVTDDFELGHGWGRLTKSRGA